MKTMAFGPSGETRLHPRQKAQIEVATSVCTGGSNMPPAYCDLIFRVSHSKDKSRESKCSFGFFGPSGETRTRGILLPKQARYQLRYTRITYFVVVNYVVKMILPQKSLTFKREKVAEFAHKSGKTAHLRGEFQNSVRSPKPGALPTGPHPDTKCIIHDIRRKCKYIL